jgi:phosphatidate cytidylyltransferase
MSKVPEQAAVQMSQGLRARVITAFLLGPALILAVLLLPTVWIALLMAVFVGMAAWEWAGLAGVQQQAGRTAYVALTLGCMVLIWLLASRDLDSLILALAALWWLVLSVRLALIRRIDPVSVLEPSLLALGVLVLVAPWLALVNLHALSGDGPFIALSLLMLIWLADSAAYFGGRRFGHAKLSVLLSPGKTRAGVYSGMLVGVVWGLLTAWVLGLTALQTVFLLIVCVLAVVMSVVGDLFESLLKRRRGLKDAGSLLPGHGGMLDRVDSMTAAAPLFALGLLWLNIGQ